MRRLTYLDTLFSIPVTLLTVVITSFFLSFYTICIITSYADTIIQYPLTTMLARTTLFIEIMVVASITYYGILEHILGCKAKQVLKDITIIALMINAIVIPIITIALIYIYS
ncbi:MAG: hypothetical protein GXO43_06920 [Crenarchaeota archaeon]|nr:hypothetical protein [Thermoproteota archaeon]